MPYVIEVCVAGGTMEICRYYTPRIGVKGEKREKREKLTPEAQKRVNQRLAEKTLRRTMNENFANGDVLVRLDFRDRPAGSREMQRLIADAVKKMRREYRKAGKPLRYIYVKEVGPRGGRHIHMVLGREDMDVLAVLQKCWPHGGIHVDPMHTAPQFGQIASYFIKYASRTEETEGKLVGKRWYASRNLRKPKVTKRVVKSNRWREKVRKRKGSQLEKGSVRSGVSELTGYRYFSYTLIRQGVGSG